MFDPKYVFDGLISLVFGFGLMLAALMSLAAALYAATSPTAHEHPFVSLFMARRRLLTTYVVVALIIDLFTMTWIVTRIAVTAMVVLYALSVYVIIPATRRNGKVIPY